MPPTRLPLSASGIALLLAAVAASGCHRAPAPIVTAGDASTAPNSAPRSSADAPSTPVDACRINGERAPLLVRWTPAERNALEAAMRDGIAIIAADDCRGIRLLRGCHARGRYGYLGAELVTRRVDLATDEELRVNAPLAHEASANDAASSTMRVEYTIAGRRATTRAAMGPDELEGDCGGATHFVSSADIGVVVERAAPAKEGRRQQGSCGAGRPGDAEPPVGCQTIIAVGTSLIARLGERISFERAPDGTVAPIGMCPHPMVISGKRCTRPPVATPYLCAFGDEQECRAQCERGDPNSCDVLGFMLWHGKGVAKDLAAAASAYAKSCEQGDEIACSNLAWFVHEGDGVARDTAKAAALFDRACALGSGVGCTNRALAFLDGVGVVADAARGMALLERTCDAGVADACEALAERSSHPDAGTGDPSRARALMDELCVGGNGKPCAWMARTTFLAAGDNGDHTPAVPYLDRACRVGYDPSCVMLGLLYRQGDGVARDDVRATRLMAHACEDGDPDGCHNLGIAYEHGKGVAPDPARAAKLYQQACDASVAVACTYLGDFAAHGTGVAKNETRARMLYARACQLGDPNGCTAGRRQ